jgi:hypothetical protein
VRISGIESSEKALSRASNAPKKKKVLPEKEDLRHTPPIETVQH